MNEQDVFITAIHIRKVRHIDGFTIPLSETERKHLIITGKNGSGKTSLLLAINYFFEHHLAILKDTAGSIFKNPAIGGIRVNLSEKYSEEFLIVLFESKRTANLHIPQGISKIDFKKKYQSTEKINNKFIQYIVNLKAERSFAKDDNDNETVTKIDTWFLNFENSLKVLFETDNLQLIFDRKNYNFYIQIPNREPFTLAQLSDGYSAVITILTELILRMEANGNRNYEQQGIVLIDEIETHLHVALQKKVLPFLCGFFRNIQFIVTTHSPFVLSSISNAVICDLEKREVISEDLSGYSYSALVESYFDVDKYSAKLKKNLARFEYLSEKDNLNDDEQDEYDNLQEYFDNLPKFNAKELECKLQQIELKKLSRRG